ncbi:hypothetical protein EVAR_7185_1 [Eumeta japonica]|uniref:Uncharacterized protein n=1 Tax=Eumeta variegata TaxID=151549 RepID=A0A4C1U6T2_EUMVA|nr:hypothetical protein EVAR_7185_1 [Eumeta japonica]
MIASFFNKARHVATVALNNCHTVNSDWYMAICLPEVIDELRKGDLGDSAGARLSIKQITRPVSASLTRVTPLPCTAYLDLIQRKTSLTSRDSVNNTRASGTVRGSGDEKIIFYNGDRFTDRSRGKYVASS